ncbi:unnamed protein product [Cuscuta epithymum]|uniref:Uncharacterized protein n=1 Tax=Cuscuta epithymum TaxID=186058 RepID=A0AAV0F629_9ASTE|nr:unnamed protein product [Cuscuta epithymum]
MCMVAGVRKGMESGKMDIQMEDIQEVSPLQVSFPSSSDVLGDELELSNAYKAVRRLLTDRELLDRIADPTYSIADPNWSSSSSILVPRRSTRLKEKNFDSEKVGLVFQYLLGSGPGPKYCYTSFPCTFMFFFFYFASCTVIFYFMNKKSNLTKKKRR